MEIFWLFFLIVGVPIAFMLILPFFTYAMYKERIKQKQILEIQQEAKRRKQEEFIKNFFEEQQKRG